MSTIQRAAARVERRVSLRCNLTRPRAMSRRKAPQVTVLVVLHPELGRADPLKWRIGGAILKPLSVSIVLTQPSCRRVIEPCMKSSTSVLALRSLPALEAIGSNSGLVAPAT